MKLFRLLRSDEIECRVSRCSEKGAVLLLYKTARTDADLLDETFGPDRWENDFKVVDGTLYGGICVTLNDGDKVWKWDAGTESNTEAEKGRASDAFKRAGFKWGLGRELYSAPFVFIPAGKCKVVEKNGRFSCFDSFEVADIAYDAQERISYLRITLKNATVFEWGDPGDSTSKAEAEPDGFFCAECGRPIRDGKKKDGSVWPAEKVAAYTKLRYGKTLCVECGTIAAEKDKEIKR